MKGLIRRVFIVLLAVIGLALSPLSQATYAQEPEIVDGIAAIVNGDVITYSQVRSLSMPREKVLRAQYHGDELVNKIKEIRMAALQDLIDRQLIIQAFKKESYQIPDHYVDERVHEIIRESFGGDRNTFIKTLEAQNYTLGEFKKLETERMIVQAMRSKNVKRNMAVSPTKIEDYYRTHRDEFTSKEEVKLRMIMIPSRAETGNAAAQKAMAEEILGKLANGANFDRLAQIYSEDSTRDLGGDWGWIERKTLAAPLEQVAFNLPAGKFSHVIELGANYYILKVDEKRGGEAPSFAKLRPEIEKKLIQEESQRH